MTDSSHKPFLLSPAPDVVVFQAGKSAGLEQLSKDLEARASGGKFYLIVDFTDFSAGIGADLRERGPKLVRPEWLLGVVYVNASTSTRVALKVLKLAMMLSKNPFPSEYADSMEGALAIVNEMREGSAAESAGR